MTKPLLAAAMLALAGHAAAQTAPESKSDTKPDPYLARNLAATCANCHGTDGRAVMGGVMAPLAGYDKATLLQRLSEYRAGTRPATIMHQITKGYTDAQLDLIAGYFAAQKK